MYQYQLLSYLSYPFCMIRSKTVLVSIQAKDGAACLTDDVALGRVLLVGHDLADLRLVVTPYARFTLGCIDGQVVGSKSGRI